MRVYPSPAIPPVVAAQTDDRPVAECAQKQSRWSMATALRPTTASAMDDRSHDGARGCCCSAATGRATTGASPSAPSTAAGAFVRGHDAHQCAMWLSSRATVVASNTVVAAADCLAASSCQPPLLRLRRWPSRTATVAVMTHRAADVRRRSSPGLRHRRRTGARWVRGGAKWTFMRRPQHSASSCPAVARIDSSTNSLHRGSCHAVAPAPASRRWTAMSRSASRQRNCVPTSPSRSASVDAPPFHPSAST